MNFRYALLFLFFTSPPITEAAKPPSNPPPPSQPQWGGSDNRMLILDAATDKPVNHLEAGKNYKLRVTTSDLTEITNITSANWTWMNGLYDGSKLMDFRVDTTQGIGYVPAPPNHITWNFTLLDSPDIYERGSVRFRTLYKAGRKSYSAEKHYEIYDTTPDYGFAINNGAPVLNITMNLGHMGDRISDTDLQNLSQRMTDSFLYASKGYVHVNFNYLGRTSFPAENSGTGILSYDYSDWWNSKNHNLTGTSLLPVNLSNPSDAELIKTFYYRDHPSIAKTDIMNNSPYWLTTSEIPIGWSVAPSKILCGLDTFHSYKESIGGVMRYGKSANIEWANTHHQTTTCLHEFAHTRTLAHPAHTFSPSPSAWTVKGYNSFEFMVNIMHQGLHNNRPFIDLFFTDADIARLAGLTPIVAPQLPIPRLAKSPDPITGSTVLLMGSKEPGAGIIINGTQHIANNDPSSSWSVSMPASVGSNRYLVSQTIMVDGIWRQSRDYAFITKRLSSGEIPGSNPSLTVTKTFETSKQVGLDINAEAAGGLSAIKWWVEKLTPSGFRPVQYAGHRRVVEGAAKVSAFYVYNFGGDGTYRIKFRAYGSGKVSPSSIQTLEFVIGSGAAVKLNKINPAIKKAKYTQQEQTPRLDISK